MQKSLFDNIQPNNNVQPPLQQCSVSRSTFYQGDCLVEMDKIADNSVDLVCTDPPYTVTKSGDYKGTGFINGHWREDKNTSNRNAKKGEVS